MSDIPVKTFCPFGKTCQEIKDTEIHRCVQYIKFSKEDKDEWGCSFAWMPILLVENTFVNKSNSASIESLRNEIVNEQEKNRDFSRNLVTKFPLLEITQ